MSSLARLLLVLLLSLAALPAAADEGTAPLRRFALIAGANDGGEGRVRLRYAVSDATAVAKVLGELGGLAEEDRVVLVEPTPSALLDGFARLRERMGASAGEGRTELLVYYSGHSDEAGLLLGGERVGYAELRRSIDAMPADVRIAILDSCASGAITRAKGGTMRAPFLVDASAAVKGHAFLTSASADEAAQESDSIGGSFFTHYLVSGMRGAADSTRDGRVTLNEAYHFAFASTLARTEKTRGGPQHAGFDIQLVGSGDVVITELRGAGAGLVLASDLGGRIFVRGASGQLVAELNKQPGYPVALALEPGDYRVTVDGEGGLREAKLTLAAGAPQELVAAALGPATAPEATVARGPGKEPVTVQAELVPSFGTEEDAVVDGLSFGFFGVRAAEVDGVQLSILASLVDRDLDGGQLSTLLTDVGGDLEGAQLSALAALVRGDAVGLQSGTVVSWTSGSFEGAQLGTGLSYTGGDFDGFQASAAVAIASGKVTGAQASSGFAYADRVEGVQASVIGVAGQVDGLQLGVINYGGQVDGLQLGVINTGRDVDVPIGILNFISEGIHDVELSGAETGFGSLGLKLGGNIVYTELLVGSRAVGAGDDTRPLLWSGLAIGGRGRLTDDFYLDVDLAGGSLQRDFGHSDGNLLTSLRATVGYELGAGFAVVAGPTLNGLVHVDGPRYDVGVGPQLLFGGEDGAFRMWPGFRLGVAL